MKRHPLLAFLLLTFSISWGIPGLVLWLSTQIGAFEFSIEEYSPLSYIAAWAPAIAAFTVIAMNRGWAGVRTYAHRVASPTGHWNWYLAVLIGIPLLKFVAAAILEALGREALMMPTILLGGFMLAALLRATEGPVEELGWRGFALPLLQRRFTGLTASLILGFIWGFWHVPAMLLGRSLGDFDVLEGSVAIVLLHFFIGIILTSVVITVVYNGTDGSIPLAFLFHWLTNLPYPWEAGADISIAETPFWLVITVVLMITVGRQYLGRRNLVTEVASGVRLAR